MSDKPDRPGPSPEAARAAKADPESLALRAKPRKVVRFKRRLLIGIAGIGALAIFGTAWFALRGAHLVYRPSDLDLYSTGRKRLPDWVTALPSSYDHVKLGSPLPGDLGLSVAERERSLGVNPADTSFKPNPEADAARAERMRLAQQARQAGEAGVFFRISNNDAAAPSESTGGTGNSATPTNGATSPATGGAGLNPDPTRDLSSGLSTEARSAEAEGLAREDPNAQGRKLDLVNGKPDKDIYNPHALQTPASPYELLAGTVISASLVTGLNTDLPGNVIAQVTEDVYDSATGRYLLVPQGSRLIGTSDSVVAFGQKRALVVWQRIVMPNGTSIQIDNLPATDAAGYTGLEDEVDYHTWTLLKGIAMSTLLGVGTQASFGSGNSDLVEAIRQSAQESTNEAGQRIVEKNLDVQSTITVRPGWPIRILLDKDLILQPYAR